MCATQIQALWRGYIAYNKFIHVISDIILVQSVFRRFKAIKLVYRRLDQQRILVAAVTRLSASWRRYHAEKEYKYKLAGKKLVVSYVP